MAWKPREPELTQEEAILMAREELKPYWHGLPPLAAAVNSPAGVPMLYPLEPEFSEKTYLFCFCDISDDAGERSFEFTNEFFNRYCHHDVNVVAVLTSPFQSFLKPKYVEKWQRIFNLNPPILIDHDGGWSRALVSPLLHPAFVFIRRNQVEFRTSSVDWIEKTERMLQIALRNEDPGLALFPIFKAGSKSVEFLSKKSIYLNESTHEFVSKSVTFSGAWKFEKEFVTTEDPKATIEMIIGFREIALVAEPGTDSGLAPKLLFEVPGFLIKEEALLRDSHFGEAGKVQVHVESARSYRCMSFTKEMNGHKMIVSFPNANDTHPRLFCLRS